MAKINLRYVQRFKDRHGHVRHYFRRPGCKRVPLPGNPGSSEFMEAYALASQTKREVAAERTKPGSISALVIAYYASAEFKALAESTRRNYTNILDRFREEHGHRAVADLQPKFIRIMLDKKADAPGAARSFLKRLRTLMQFAVERDWRPDNPALNIRPPKTAPGGFRAWEEEDIAAFEKRWPVGTRAHLALVLLLHTAQRRSDVTAMGRQHVKDDKIQVAQYKGRDSVRPVRLWIPLHPQLKGVLDATPTDNMTYLVTSAGKPFTHAGFTNWFVECAKAAGLPEGSTPHGLRKAAARRLAEAGASPHQIASITGHRTLKEVTHYTESVDQARLADAAIAALKAKS